MIHGFRKDKEMKLKATLFISAALLVTAALWRNSGEPVACRDLDFDYSRLSVSELTTIAASCQDDAVARLYYNRAYYADLLETAASGEFDPRLSALAHAHRLYMGMIEAFAPRWYPDEKARVAFLNTQYEEMATVAELKLRQYNRLAGQPHVTATQR